MGNLRILIVEDEPIVAAGLCAVISAHDSGWKVVGTADNGRRGLALATELKPDIVLTDIRMPYIDGLKLSERIRQQDKDVIIIILTAHADFNYAQHAIKFSVFDYILKPSSPREILGIIKKAEASLEENVKALKGKFYGSGAETSGHGINNELICHPGFMECIKAKDTEKLQDLFFGLTEAEGLWGMNAVKAVKAVEVLLQALNGRLREESMLALDRYLSLRAGLMKIYEIKSIEELKNYSADFLEQAVLSAKPGCGCNLTVKKALEYVDESLSADISLKAAAEKMYLNYFYFSQLFKKETGMTFSDYLLLVRMERAKEFLKDLKFKTYEVACKVGYVNTKHFSKSFRRAYGLYPSEYRSMYAG